MQSLIERGVYAVSCISSYTYIYIYIHKIMYIYTLTHRSCCLRKHEFGKWAPHRPEGAPRILTNNHGTKTTLGQWSGKTGGTENNLIWHDAYYNKYWYGCRLATLLWNQEATVPHLNLAISESMLRAYDFPIYLHTYVYIHIYIYIYICWVCIMFDWICLT